MSENKQAAVAKPYDVVVSVSRTLEKHEAGDRDQPDHLRKIPVSHGGV